MRQPGLADHESAAAAPSAPAQWAAVIVNPTKFDGRDKFRDEIRTVMTEHGWGEPMWLETTPEDPGEGQARAAMEAGAGLILACGGDGTVTACATALIGRGIPLAIIPAGTGNLLARNLGLPREPGDAAAAALTGDDRELDVGRANGRPFLVMAGLGIDAKMLDGTSEASKKRAGWAAYAATIVRHLRDQPMRVSLRAGDEPPRQRRASAVIVGNVGSLQGGLPLLPDARPDDGRLDLVVLTARDWAGWLVVAAHVLLRRSGGTGRVARSTFRELSIDADGEYLWELDGELMGSTRHLAVTIDPGRLLLRVPRSAAAERPGAEETVHQ